MDIRTRVLTARLAEKAQRNPKVAKQLGIEVRYKQMINDPGKRDNTTC